MTKVYPYLYLIDGIDEQVIDLQEIVEFEKKFSFLPEIQPRDSLVAKIMKLV
ncbi:MAG: hypothetical protein HUK15_02805 [Bacteroidales bacterium]|nr:hypothetical protein [Bacteroidales bacterium]